MTIAPWPPPPIDKIMWPQPQYPKTLTTNGSRKMCHHHRIHIWPIIQANKIYNCNRNVPLVVNLVRNVKKTKTNNHNQTNNSIYRYIYSEFILIKSIYHYLLVRILLRVYQSWDGLFYKVSMTIKIYVIFHVSNKTNWKSMDGLHFFDSTSIHIFSENTYLGIFHDLSIYNTFPI